MGAALFTRLALHDTHSTQACTQSFHRQRSVFITAYDDESSMDEVNRRDCCLLMLPQEFLSMQTWVAATSPGTSLAPRLVTVLVLIDLLRPCWWVCTHTLNAALTFSSTDTRCIGVRITALDLYLATISQCACILPLVHVQVCATHVWLL
jgi:hypothetical protein